MRDTYASWVDCTIDRENPDYPNEAVLYDEDGEIVWLFGGHFTNDQIKEALRFANKAYAVGCGDGERRKLYEIRNALGIE